MTGRHRVLVVEDDRPTAEDLADLLEALDCLSIVVDNKRDALAALQQQRICLAVFDLQIKLERDSIKGHVEAGRSLIRDARRLYPEHAGACYRLPILVISGYAREVESAVDVMKDGADDVIQKPFDSREVSRSVRQALERSGRTSHQACTTMPGPRPAPARGLVLSIPGDRAWRRTRVMVGATGVNLPDSSLRILLRLMVGKLTGEKVHKTELGSRADQGFRGISVLREALRPALGERLDLIENDHQGHYWLVDDVTIGDCDHEKLIAIGDHRIAALAERLRELRAQQRERKPRSGKPSGR
jgi:DNA-binding response OmpR family regulator